MTISAAEATDCLLSGKIKISYFLHTACCSDSTLAMIAGYPGAMQYSTFCIPYTVFSMYYFKPSKQIMKAKRYLWCELQHR